MICPVCEKEYVQKKGSRLCGSCTTNKRRHKVKQLLLDRHGNKCSRCGYNKCSAVLSFHHRNPKEKSFNISGSHCKSLEKIIEESDKCDLLCSNCHHEEHYKERQEYWNRLSKYENSRPKIVHKEKILRLSKCPSRERLEEDVNKTPLQRLSKKYGVSDKAIAQWCKKLGIKTKSRGEWAKINRK